MEILSTDTYTSLGDFGIVIIIIGAFLSGFGIVLAIEAFTEGEIFMVGVGVFVMVVGILVAYFLHDVDSTKYIEHQVIITDIDMIVEGEYEIVDMEGKLATIRKTTEEVSE